MDTIPTSKTTTRIRIGSAVLKIMSAAASVGTFLYLFNIGKYDSYIGWPTHYHFPLDRTIDWIIFLSYVIGATVTAGLLILITIPVARTTGNANSKGILQAFNKSAAPLQLLWLFPIFYWLGFFPNFIWLFTFFGITSFAAFQWAFFLPSSGTRAEAGDLPPVSWKTLLILVVICMAFVVLFSTLSIFQYHVGAFGYADSGFVAEALWNTLHGRFMYVHGFDPPMYLADHFSPIVLILLPIYALFPRHETLMVISALVLALTVVPIFLLARWEWRDNRSALCLAIAFTLYPAAQHGVCSLSYGFQAEGMAVPFLAWACYFMRRHYWKRFCFFLLLTLCCKETLAAVVLGMGLCVWVLEGKRKLSVLVMVGAIGWMLFVTKLFLPWLKGGGEYYQLGQFYDHLGDSYGEILVTILKNIFTAPLAFAKQLFHREVWMFLAQMFLPLGLLGFLSPSALLMGMPNFLMMLLSYEKPHLFSIFQHYKDPLIVVVFFAVIVGVRRFIDKDGYVFLLTKKVLFNRPLRGIPSSKYSLDSLRGVSAMLLLASFMNCYYFGPTPLSKTFEPRLITLNRRSLALARMKQRIGMDASIVTTHRAGAHFTDRKQLYVLPLTYHVRDKVDIFDVDYLLLDTKDRWAAGQTELVRDILKKISKRKDFNLHVKDESILLFKKIPNKDL